MNNKSIAAHLIALAIKDRLVSNVQFGLLAQSLPPFDAFELYTALNPEVENLRLAFLGFNDIDDRFPPEIARDVETAISWRNDPTVSSRIIVILNPTRPVDKIHSLTLLDPFTDQDLRQAICCLAEKEARHEGDYLKAAVWHSLLETDKSNRDRLPFVAAQVVDFYASLLNQSVSSSLPFIGLLPDPELSAADNVIKKLQDNYAMVEWLSDIDSQTFGTLARASSGKQKDFQRTFNNIWAYSKAPSCETLKPLTLQEVRQLREAPKSPQPKMTIQQSSVPPDIQLIDQLLKIAQERDISNRQAGIEHLEDEAYRISQMYFRENTPEDCINDPDSTHSDRSDEEEFELLSDWKTGEDIGRAVKFKEDLIHPLGESFQSWLSPLCWGGEVEAVLPSQDVPNLIQLFSGKIPLHFKPLRPFDTNDPNSLVIILQNLDEVSGEIISNDSLVSLFHTLDTHRRFLLQYQNQFLYYPQYAVQDREIHSHLRSYLDAYKKLSLQINQVCRRLQEYYPDAVERAIAQFLALDTIFVRINQPEQAPKIFVLLSPLHPLHLWKWVELSEYLSYMFRSLTDKEYERVRQATKRLPTILNTFLIHPAMYPSLPGQTETRLVFAGEIDNPENESTVGIPYYQPIAEQVVGADGIQQFAAFIRQFLILYPPAQLGLTLVLIDPPRLAPLLKDLVEFSHKSERDEHLEGAKVFVFWTETSSYDEWQSKDEDALQLFRDDPRWMLYIDLDVRTLKQIHEELSSHHIQPHITLLCDPSDAVARSTFRTVHDDATPFGVPIQVIYDV